LRLRALELKQDQTTQRLDSVQKEVQDVKKQMRALADDVFDFDAAMLYAQKYGEHFFVDLNAKGLMLTHAIIRFASFLELPETSSELGPYLDAGFSILVTIVPTMKFLGVIQKLDQEATVALAVAKAAENADPSFVPLSIRATAQVVKALPRAGDAVDVAKKVNDAKSKAMQVLKDQPERNNLNKLDATKGPIKDLVNSADLAMKVFDTAMDTIIQEFKNRLADLSATPKEQLVDIVTRLLPPRAYLTSDDLDQVETSYLWELIKNYAKTEPVTIVQTTYVNAFMNSTNPGEVIGLNDSQKRAVLKMFGPDMQRGMYCVVPVIRDVKTAAMLWGCKTVQQVRGTPMYHR
jgi:hypothetical protein